MSDPMITVEAARTLYDGGKGGHDFDHVLRVLALSERIAAAEGADLGIVRTAALLHDVGESEGRADHHLRGAEIARQLLASQPPEFIEGVAHAIAAHRFRTDPAPRTLEAQVLSDADKLDAIGAIGVARAFAYAGAHGSALWRETVAAVEAGKASGRPPTGEAYTPVHEFVYKLDVIPDRLYTGAARAIALRRQATMRAYFAALDNELAGDD